MWRRWLPEAVLLAGVAFSLFLQTTVPGEVFTVGDAGLKFVMTRQFARGEMGLDLRLPAEDWERRLWDDEALYPFVPPNVYPVGGRRYTQYPPFFPLLSAVPYRLFGWRGLYLLPLAATWAVWWSLRASCRRLGVAPAAAASALLVLAFGSPLTFYAATFWEHTPAVALLFAGAAAVLFHEPARPPGARRALLAGALVGLSCTLREENLVLAFLLLPAVALALERRTAGLFALGTTATVLALFAFNVAAFGHGFGMHAHWAPASLRARVQMGWAVLRFFAATLVEYFPAVWACLAAALGLLLAPRRDRRILLLLPVCALFLVVLPFAAPSTGGRQWGPRFLLPAIPLLCVALAAGLDAAQRRGRWWAAAAYGALAPLAAWSIHTNTWEASGYLRRNYADRMVPYSFVKESGVRHVVVAQEMVAQQLAGVIGEKTFFLADRGKDLRALARELSLRGEVRFLYMCYARYGCGPFKDPMPERYTFYTGDGRPLVQFTLRGDLDRYTVYEAALTERK